MKFKGITVNVGFYLKITAKFNQAITKALEQVNTEIPEQ